MKDQDSNEGAISSEMLKQLQKAEVDLYYVVKFPLDKKYISLYPTSDANDAETKRARQDFWEKLQLQVKDGSLPSGLHPKKKDSNTLAEVERIRKTGPVQQNYQHIGEHRENEDDEEINKESSNKVDEFFA